MASFTAIYDASVLYPAPLRDFLLRLAQTELFRVRWTEEIHREWMDAVLRNRPDLSHAQIERTRRLMDEAVPDCLVTGHEPLIEGLRLPDPGDRHVLAAAIRCQADVIVTFNTRDFPATVLDRYGIEAQHPDEFACHLIDLDQDAVRDAFRRQRAALRNPPKSVAELLDTLRRQGLVSTVELLRALADLS